MDSTAHSVHGGKVIIGAHNVNRLQVRFPAPPPAVECNPGQVVNTRVSVTKQYNLVPANGR